MCGIAGFIQFDASLAWNELELRARRMAGALAHRGPDAEGVWVQPAIGLGLAHRRLSILDLSAAGAQPMASHSGRHTIVFNGEIYNFEELRSSLPPSNWRGHSDTEVFIEAVEAWGLNEALQRTVGMYAFALWDARDRVLTLARDRFGEKPLYYGIAGGAFLFASELKALAVWPGWQGEIDRVSLDDFTRHGVIHAPRSIYRNVRKLPAASVLSIDLANVRRALDGSPQRYWSAEVVSERVRTSSSDAEATDELEVLLKRSVAGQMVADVPVGAFLSGGVDSSLTAALMQAHSTRAVRTFSIGFHETGYNEAEYARAVASHLGTEHTELYVTPNEARAVIPALPTMFDEPFADSSQIPTHLVARLARRHVTVSLSGDGGDELFGGYNRYLWTDRHWATMSAIPLTVRKLAAGAIRLLSPARWDSFWRLLPTRAQLAQPGDKMYKLADLAEVASSWQAYSWLISQHREDESLVLGVQAVPMAGMHALWQREDRAVVDNMMLADALGYLPDDIMAKVDRATMAVGLEARAPFLDHRVAEFAMRLPMKQKIRSGSGKWLLRELLHRHVPRNLIERPKMGFAVPIDSWVRGPLRPWADALLDPVRLRREGFFRVDVIERAWKEHLSGQRNWQHFLWNILMFEAWLDANPEAR